MELSYGMAVERNDRMLSNRMLSNSGVRRFRPGEIVRGLGLWSNIVSQ